MFSLSFLGGPKWRRRGPKESHVIQRENSDAVFKCEVLANPKPKYRWYKNGEVLNIRKSKKVTRIYRDGAVAMSSAIRGVAKERERKMFYLTTHSTHFIYGYMASDIWLRSILIVRKETRCRHISYSYRLTARFFLYAPSHRQDNT